MKPNASFFSGIIVLVLAIGVGVHSVNADPGNRPGTANSFKFTITTDVPSYNESTGFLVNVLPVNGYPVRYDLDCDGDGHFEFTGLTESRRCFYNQNSGKHQIQIRGDIPSIRLCKETESHGADLVSTVISVDDWGSVAWKSMESFAENCRALNQIPKTPPNLSHVTNMRRMFYRAKAFNQPLENWNVSNVTNMNGMFNGAWSFNQPLEKWNVSNVTDMSWMFSHAENFNQPLEKWDVSNVTNMMAMFWSARSFNQPLEKWDVSRVKNMAWLFSEASSFNQPLEKWDVSNVREMGLMFSSAKSFNQPLEKWDVSHVTNMHGLFAGATSFNQPLEKWDVSHVENMDDIFRDTQASNQLFEKWNISQNAAAEQEIKPIEDRKPFKFTIATDEGSGYDETNGIVINIQSLEGKYPFKYDLDCEGDGNYEYTGLTEIHKCIYQKNSGNHQIWVRGDIPAIRLCSNPTGIHNEEPKTTQPVISIDDWGDISWKSMELFAFNCKVLNQLPKAAPDLRHVRSMRQMFAYAKSFNQPLEHWNVSEVTDMAEMFWDADAFNQPLEKWDVSRVTHMMGMFGATDAFNQPLEKWNVSNVRMMDFMFSYTKSFNQPLEKWNVSSVNSMIGTFAESESFNQPLEKWDVSNVTFGGGVFDCAKAFNQPLNNWKMKNPNINDEFIADKTRKCWFEVEY